MTRHDTTRPGVYPVPCPRGCGYCRSRGASDHHEGPALPSGPTASVFDGLWDRCSTAIICVHRRKHDHAHGGCASVMRRPGHLNSHNTVWEGVTTTGRHMPCTQDVTAQ